MSFAEDRCIDRSLMLVHVSMVARRGKWLRSTTSPCVPTHHASHTLGNNDDDVDDDDDDQAAPADKWMNGKLFHWDPFFGWTSGCH